MLEKSAPSPSSFPASSSTDTSAFKRKLPPGIVLDENGKPCKVCNSWQTWAKATKKTTKRAESTSKEKDESPSAASLFSGGLGAAAVPLESPNASESKDVSARPSDCPPDVNSLGRSTWTFLHTTAAYYPVQATPTQQTSMRSLLQSVGMFYPCTYCAGDFRERMKAVEPDVSGRAGLSRWLCERHNEVNQKLGKDDFSCDKVDERWKDGPPDGRCD
jgi:FAD-linked sulfhydryl oxidase